MKCNRVEKFIDLIDDAALQQGLLVSEVWLTPTDWVEMLKLQQTKLVVDEAAGKFYLAYEYGMKLHLIRDNSSVRWTCIDVSA